MGTSRGSPQPEITSIKARMVMKGKKRMMCIPLESGLDSSA